MNARDELVDFLVEHIPAQAEAVAVAEAAADGSDGGRVLRMPEPASTARIMFPISRSRAASNGAAALLVAALDTTVVASGIGWAGGAARQVLDLLLLVEDKRPSKKRFFPSFLAGAIVRTC